MNSGIQDSFNLGWKLALVMRGRVLTQLLASYHVERGSVASGVLNLTDRITRMATMCNSVAQSVRDFLLSVLLLFLGSLGDAAMRSESIGSAINGFPDDAIDIYRIARGQSGASAELSDFSGLAYAAYGLFNGGVILVRPDGYIGYRCDDFDPVKLRPYLERVFSSS